MRPGSRVCEEGEGSEEGEEGSEEGEEGEGLVGDRIKFAFALDAYNDPVGQTDDRFTRFRDLSLPDAELLRAACLCDPDLLIFDADFGFSQWAWDNEGGVF